MNPLAHPLLTAVGVLALIGFALLRKENEEPKAARNPAAPVEDDERYDGFALGI